MNKKRRQEDYERWEQMKSYAASLQRRLDMIHRQALAVDQAVNSVIYNEWRAMGEIIKPVALPGELCIDAMRRIIRHNADMQMKEGRGENEITASGPAADGDDGAGPRDAG